MMEGKGRGREETEKGEGEKAGREVKCEGEEIA